MRRDFSSVYVASAQLRLDSNALMSRAVKAKKQLCAQFDHMVLLRCSTYQLFDESIRIEDLRRRSEIKIYLPISNLGRLIDGEICEDPELLGQLNAIDYRCDKCERAEVLSAVIRFEAMQTSLAICGECFQDLTRLALGHVT